MIKSMTGFGKETVITDNNNYQIEIRALNSKQSDINLRIPYFLKPYELDIRNLLSKALVRGKVDAIISNEKVTANAVPTINQVVAKQYFNEIKQLYNALDISNLNEDEVLSSILKMPEVFSSEEFEIESTEWNILKKGIEEAIAKVNEFRVEEGKALSSELKERTGNILQFLKQVDPYEPDRVLRIKERIKSNLANYTEDMQADQNRLEQEMIYYIEKLDITEEKVRLDKHCEYFLETLENPNSSGKKLGFISQEIGREINTMGAKAYDADIQKIVVLMKDELEKIKEQLFNVL